MQSRLHRTKKLRYQGYQESKEVELPYKWRPREDQLPFFDYMENGGDRAIVVAHRKWGKDTVALRWESMAAFQRIGSYWHMFPKYSDARKAIWDPIDPTTGTTRLEAAFPYQIRANTRDTDMFIKFINGSTWQLVGSDNFNSYVGAPPVGIVFSEHSLGDPKAWPYLRPILRQNKGWAAFLFTPRGQNHAYDLLKYAQTRKDWFAQVVDAEHSPVFTPDELKEELDELVGVFGEHEGKSFFDQEYLCSFNGFQFGTYYGQQMKLAHETGRITKVPWTERLPVFTAWDLGVDDSMSIWIYQITGSQFRFIDYIEDTGQNFDFYRKELIDERPYAYSEHFLPHDIRAREMGPGLAGEGALTRQEVLESMGIRPIKVVERARDQQAVLSGIFSVRDILANCYFDEEKCQRGIQALEGYKAKYDDEKKKLSNSPVLDWTAHGADAFRTFAVGWRKDGQSASGKLLEAIEKYYGGVA
jgi:phage terminase large subunit